MDFHEVFFEIVGTVPILPVIWNFSMFWRFSGISWTFFRISWDFWDFTSYLGFQLLVRIVYRFWDFVRFLEFMGLCFRFLELKKKYEFFC